jgi:hypothetical protein
VNTLVKVVRLPRTASHALCRGPLCSATVRSIFGRDFSQERAACYQTGMLDPPRCLLECPSACPSPSSHGPTAQCRTRFSFFFCSGKTSQSARHLTCGLVCNEMKKARRYTTFQQASRHKTVPFFSGAGGWGVVTAIVCAWGADPSGVPHEVSWFSSTGLTTWEQALAVSGQALQFHPKTYARRTNVTMQRETSLSVRCFFQPHRPWRAAGCDQDSCQWRGGTSCSISDAWYVDLGCCGKGSSCLAARSGGVAFP